jgi:hypothetical protein
MPLSLGGHAARHRTQRRRRRRQPPRLLLGPPRRPRPGRRRSPARRRNAARQPGLSARWTKSSSAAANSWSAIRMRPMRGATRPWSNACAPKVKGAPAPGTPLRGRQRRLTEAVARNYFKLLAYKDEYEVARLFSRPAFGRTGRQLRRRLPARTSTSPCPGAAAPRPAPSRRRSASAPGCCRR